MTTVDYKRYADKADNLSSEMGVRDLGSDNNGTINHLYLIGRGERKLALLWLKDPMEGIAALLESTLAFRWGTLTPPRKRTNKIKIVIIEQI